MIPALSGVEPLSVEFWNKWRSLYDTLTCADNAAIMADFYACNQTQVHYTLPAIIDFFAKHPAKRVIEVGGWDGEVARQILSERPEIEWWTNYEICRGAAAKLSCPRYEAPDLSSFVWDLPLSIAKYDTLMASHILEHMKLRNIHALLDRLPTVRAVYVDAPIPLDTTTNTWAGYQGSHILEVGWKQLEDAFAEHRFACTNRMISPRFGDSIRWFARPAP